MAVKLWVCLCWTMLSLWSSAGMSSSSSRMVISSSSSSSTGGNSARALSSPRRSGNKRQATTGGAANGSGTLLEATALRPGMENQQATTSYTDAAEFDIYNDNNNNSSEDLMEDRQSASRVHLYLGGILIPAIGVLGVLGNLLNLTILSWRCAKREDDTLEKVALIGLIALAVSDMCFCLTIIPFAFVPKPRVLYDSLSFELYFYVYGEYVQNVFIKTSTWLTVIVATARYIAICHPLKARFCFGINPMRLAIIVTYVFWALFLLPLSWSLQILQHDCGANTTCYLIDHGSLARNEKLQITFTYLWAFLGYFIPVAFLVFCNVRLIQALRESHRLRKSIAHTARGPSAHSNARKTSNRITLTLITLVVMFITLVSPSELLHFWGELSADVFASYEVAMVVTNLLQSFNFALHFVLYCVVNVTFRRTLVLLAMRCVRWVRRGGRRYPFGNASTQSFSTLTRRETLTPSNVKSNETHI